MANRGRPAGSTNGPVCGAKLKHPKTLPDGSIRTNCVNPAGMRTDHVGTGKCWVHGGRSHGRPITTGRRSRYAAITRPRIAELLKQFEDDPDPTNLLPEVHLLRSLVLDYVERYDENTEALQAWHASFSDSYQADLRSWHERNDHLEICDRSDMPTPVGYGKPRQVLDIVSASKFLADIGSMVERIKKQEQSSTISMVAFREVLSQHAIQFLDALRETIPDDADLQERLVIAVEKRWDTITVPASSVTVS